MFRSALLATALSARTLLPFALDVFAADPETRIEDAYKWLFQAASGGEHAIPNEESARSWLEQEWESLGRTRPGEPLEVPLRPDGALVRLNLRPYRDRGGSPDELLRAFLRSARSFAPEPGLFRASWAALGKALAAHPLGPLNEEEWRRLDAAMRANGYPAVHHSRAYTSARHPAYRVLTKEEARRLLRSLEGRRP
ncbi:MAG: hypothetical protein ACM3JH_01365 [Acidithiobacillales bacterium]